MAKVNYRIGVLLVLTLWCYSAGAQAYPVTYRVAPPDSAKLALLGLTTAFPGRMEAEAYLGNLLSLLQSRGFVTASLDSVERDSARAIVTLFLGEPYQWQQLRTEEKDAPLLEALHFPAFGGSLDFSTLNTWQRRILDYLEDNGYPFGKIYLDSFQLSNNNVAALLKIDRGPLYKIDSIQVIGDARVNSDFLQKFLQLPRGSLYSRSRLAAISKRLLTLSYLEEEKPADLTLLATGAILNLYVKARRSSQINALVGFLPNSDPSGLKRKLLLTVDANILLRNALGNGETIGLLWQQLQKGSPRLNLLYEQPYVFRSPFGARFSLDMYKQDSLYLNINMNLGASYQLGETKTASVFLQRRSTLVSAINEAAVIQSRRLPQEADVSSVNLGVGYDYNHTDYRYNPRRGLQAALTATAGTKTLKKNNLVLELKDPADPSFDFDRLYDTVQRKAYQFRINLAGAKFVPLGRQTTLKLGADAGIFQSPRIFRNELFRIGGAQRLRGFNEESEAVSQYALGTVEFRLLTGLNSAFFAFVDGGWGKYPLELQTSHTYLSTGAGLSVQPKAGLMNLTWAIGRRDDGNFNLRQSKIHVGFVSFF